jgi:hypothetical protein
MNWVNLALDRDKWQAPVNMAMDDDSIKCGEIFD